MLTLGQYKLASILPEGLRDYAYIPLDKKNSKNLLKELAVKYPDKYEEVLSQLQTLSKEVSTTHGKNLSVSLKDLIPPKETQALRSRIKADMGKVLQNPRLTPSQKKEAIGTVFKKYTSSLSKDLEDAAVSDNNVFGKAIKHGFRGSPQQLVQLMFGDVGVEDHRGEVIPIAGLKGYGEGVSPEDFWVGASNSRKGVIGVQFATANTGYMGKQLSLLANRSRITEEDCGVKDSGMFRDLSSSGITGTVLAKDTAGISSGTVLTRSHLKKLSGVGRKKVLIRTPTTCQAENGICQKCMGRDSDGNYPPIGSFVGIDGARLLSEPLVQTSLGSKHTGSSKTDNLAGFDTIEQFFNVPKSFKGKAILSEKDGKVMSIKKASQGGTNIIVNNQLHYLPSDKISSVSVGDTLEVGDALSLGLPSPKEVADLKGIGPAREYFSNKLKDILSNSGIDIYDRHVDAIVKDYYNNVEITDPEGFEDYAVGQVVPYTFIQKRYKPPVNTASLSLNRAKGMYLQKPLLQYTIGAKITPSAIKEFKNEGILEIPVSKQKPPFKPYVSRLIDRPSKDLDWKTRLGGWNIKRSLLDSVTHGSESKHEDTSSALGTLVNMMR